jgi:hypothetical protein
MAPELLPLSLSSDFFYFPYSASDGAQSLMQFGLILSYPPSYLNPKVQKIKASDLNLKGPEGLRREKSRSINALSCHLCGKLESREQTPALPFLSAQTVATCVESTAPCPGIRQRLGPCRMSSQDLRYVLMGSRFGKSCTVPALQPQLQQRTVS